MEAQIHAARKALRSLEPSLFNITSVCLLRKLLGCETLQLPDRFDDAAGYILEFIKTTNFFAFSGRETRTCTSSSTTKDYIFGLVVSERLRSGEISSVEDGVADVHFVPVDLGEVAKIVIANPPASAPILGRANRGKRKLTDQFEVEIDNIIVSESQHVLVYFDGGRKPADLGVTTLCGAPLIMMEPSAIPANPQPDGAKTFETARCAECCSDGLLFCIFLECVCIELCSYFGTYLRYGSLRLNLADQWMRSRNHPESNRPQSNRCRRLSKWR